MSKLIKDDFEMFQNQFKGALSGTGRLGKSHSLFYHIQLLRILKLSLAFFHL